MPVYGPSNACTVLMHVCNSYSSTIHIQTTMCMETLQPIHLTFTLHQNHSHLQFTQLPVCWLSRTFPLQSAARSPASSAKEDWFPRVSSPSRHWEGCHHWQTPIQCRMSLYTVVFMYREGGRYSGVNHAASTHSSISHHTSHPTSPHLTPHCLTIADHCSKQADNVVVRTNSVQHLKLSH